MSLAKPNQQLAENYFQQRNFFQADHLARLVLAEQPDNGRMWLLAGMSCYRLRDFGLARAALEHAGLLVPLDAETQCALAECYIQLGRLSHAKSLLQHLVGDPHCPTQVLPSIAAGLGRVGDYQGALAACRLASAREPEKPEPLFGMTYYLRRLGYPASVLIPVMAKAHDLSMGDAFYRCALALLLAENNRREEAYELLKDFSVTQIVCPCLLRRMMALFQSLGDFTRWSECRGQLAQASEPDTKCKLRHPH